jgi:hypothetical protein
MALSPTLSHVVLVITAAVLFNLAFAAFMFAIMLYFYSQNMMGGGDVKILTVAFLWIGLDCALVFAVLMAIFAIAHIAAAKFGWAKFQQVGEHKRIPLAPCVAGALIVCFMLGCLRPVSLQPAEPSVLHWMRFLPWPQS